MCGSPTFRDGLFYDRIFISKNKIKVKGGTGKKSMIESLGCSVNRARLACG